VSPRTALVTLDVLVNNAGISLDTGAPVTTGSLTWSTAPNPQFDYQAAGTGSGAAYRSSKTALNALTVFYAQALASDGIKVKTRSRPAYVPRT
jgi:NAD(P)-dependent dehydrogenase (short-subunit alcohol dehydrogenase family)